jgi:transposase
MWIIGVDYHPSVQQIAFVNNDTGECGERRLSHSDGEAEKFYRELKAAGCEVRVGMEATGHARWFERLLAELGFELWIGDPAQIKAKRVRKQKTDRLDAALLLQLLLEDRFPRVWVPSPENRDLRQLLWHRHRLVQMRTRIMNQLQAVAMNEGVRRRAALWSKSGRAQLESLPLAPSTSPATARGVAPDNASWRGTYYRSGFRADHRLSGALCLWQADRQLCRADPL